MAIARDVMTFIADVPEKLLGFSGNFFFCGIILKEILRQTPLKRKEKKFIFLLIPIIFVGVFLIFNSAVAVNAESEACENMLDVGCGLMKGFNWVLYVIFSIAGLTVNFAASILEFVLEPSAVRMLFDLSGVYTSWQLVRDFFNLFFILTLLFIAFATIFQISSYNYKATLGKLLLMAMLVNFSWPITRFIIDATNVPMYFFLESMFEDKDKSTGSKVVETALQTGQIDRLVLGMEDGESSLKITGNDQVGTHLMKRLIVGIVFIFLFGVSLTVLGILLFIRLIMLVILLAFSAVGFAGLAIPGFKKYATMWWDKLLQYAFFGPASALILLVALQFMKSFNSPEAKAEVAKAVAGQGGLLGVSLIGMITILIPIILVWVSIGIGKVMGVAGAGAVTSRAQQFSKWAGRKASGADAVQKRWKAYSSERDARSAEKFKSNNIGTKFGKLVNREQDQLIATGGGGFYSKAKREDARNRFQSAQKEQVDMVTKRHAIGGTMTDDRLKELHKQARNEKDKTLLAATTKEMSKRESTAKDVTEDDMRAINAQFAAVGGVRSAVADEVKEEVAKKNAGVAYGNNEEEMTKAFASGKIKLEDQTANGLTKQVLKAANTAGKIDEKILQEMQKDSEKNSNLNKFLEEATNEIETEYQAKVSSGVTITEDEKKNRVRAHKMHLAQTGTFNSTVAGDIDFQNEVFKKSNADTLKKLNPAQLEMYADQLAVSMNPGQFSSVMSKLAEDGKDVSATLDKINHLPPTPEIARIQKAIQDDHRLKYLV